MLLNHVVQGMLGIVSLDRMAQLQWTPLRQSTVISSFFFPSLIIQLDPLPSIETVSLFSPNLCSIRCGPCQMIAPHFENFSKKYTNVKFVKVDVDAQDRIAEMCGIRAMPTFQFYKDGKKVDELMGANVAALEQKVAALAA